LSPNCPDKLPNDNKIAHDKLTEADVITAIDEPWTVNEVCKRLKLRMVSFVNVDTKGTSGCVYLSATINDKNVFCMCQADSDVNFLPYDMIDPKLIKPTTVKFYAANGTTIEILGQACVTIQLASQIKFETDVLISEKLACPLFGKQWLKKHTTSWDFVSGKLTIQGYNFKLEEEEDLPNVCRKIRIIEDAVVPPQSRLTVAGLVLISSARPVNVPDWLTRHRLVKPWVQILHSLVDNRASSMSLFIVNDSDEEYVCRKGEVITTMIPDPMGLDGWYGEEQAAQVKREATWDFIGPIPSPSG